MKNRILASLICILIIAATLSACEPPANNTGPEQLVADNLKDDESQKGNETSINSGLSNGDYSNQDILTSFIEDYIDVKDPLLDLINEKDSEGRYLLELLPAYSADMLIVSLPMYDLLNGKGKLIFSGFDGYKEIDGKIIKFGSDHTWEDTLMGLHDKGDKYTESGNLDMGNNVLVKEEYTERGGKIIKRGIFELVRLSDGRFISQSFYMSEGVEASYVFINVKNNEMDLIIAEGNKNVDLRYKSIRGAGNVSAAEMAKGYKNVMIIRVADGKVSFEKS